MSSDTERRGPSDRRQSPRGGRRPGDPIGFYPLILVANDDANNGAHCVAILAKLRFAVAPAYSVEEAIKVMESLRPNLIVARLADEPVLRQQMDTNPSIGQIPIVTVTERNEDPEVLIEDIRRALRA